MYVAFFLPCSIHTAWLSYSVGLAALMIPKALDYTAHLEGMAALIAALITALGRPPHSPDFLKGFQRLWQKGVENLFDG